jgi:BirA family biotin operon repressor/biotin-[acetyl-CoA-carboxylase] ligase
MILLTKESIIKGLENKDIKVDVLQKTESTNDYFENIISDSPYLCVADYQSKGRGRLNREWVSPSGSNIYISLLYRFYKYTNQLSGLSLSTGLAIREALMASSEVDGISVKWPNDILYEGRKLAGILIETKSIDNQFYAVVGIGVNVNMENPEEEIQGRWISLRQITGKEQDRSELISNIVNSVIKYYKKLERYGFSQFESEWEANDVLRGRQVKLKQDNRIFEGLCLGVDECGRLSIRTDTGLRFFNYGEATTR